MSEDLVLVPEVEARRALRGRRIRMHVLVPVGAWLGCGKLRVLRVRHIQGETEEIAEMSVGYEAYRQ